MVAQFTAKTTNSEKAIYFLSTIKSHILFKCKKIYVFQFYVQEGERRGGRLVLPLPPPFLYGPVHQQHLLFLSNWDAILLTTEQFHRKKWNVSNVSYHTVDCCKFSFSRCDWLLRNMLIFYKHNAYKHNHPEIEDIFTHKLSIIASLLTNFFHGNFTCQ